jgi:hypothetical protein
MVNQPHILLGTFNDSIMIDHRQFELVIRIIIPFPFSLHTFMLFLYFPNFTVAPQHHGDDDVVPNGYPLLSVKWRIHKPGTHTNPVQPNNQTTRHFVVAHRFFHAVLVSSFFSSLFSFVFVFLSFSFSAS